MESLKKETRTKEFKKSRGEVADQVWWHMPIIPSFGRLSQEDCLEFEAVKLYITIDNKTLSQKKKTQ